MQERFVVCEVVCTEAGSDKQHPQAKASRSVAPFKRRKRKAEAYRFNCNMQVKTKASASEARRKLTGQRRQRWSCGCRALPMPITSPVTCCTSTGTLLLHLFHAMLPWQQMQCRRMHTMYGRSEADFLPLMASEFRSLPAVQLNRMLIIILTAS